MAFMLSGIFVNVVSAKGCMDKLFTVTINNSLSIADAIDNLAETCGLTVVVKDAGARQRLNKKLYYVKLNNASLKSFLDTLLKDNDLSYTLKGNKLSISYLVTRTFKVHYVTGQRKGTSNANVQVAGGNSNIDSNDKTPGGSTISIETNQEFQFWSTVKNEIHHILNTAGDGSVHFTKVGDEWIGPDGQKWEYNPLEPVVNPEAGMITVTGTARQVERVSRYLAALTHQLKTEVMIDVRIIDVRINNNHSYGIDWNKIFNTSIRFTGDVTHGTTNSVTHNVSLKDGSDIGDYLPGGGISFTFSGDLTEVLKFLKTQGDVTVVSSPRVMTLNNQPAMISVGQEIYYKLTTTNKVGGSDTATSENEEVKSVFAGILLDITPEVDERGMITLKINPSITALANEEDAKNLQGVRTMPPDIKRRQIASVIKIKDGDHAILGGLITRGHGTKEEGLPVLENIPILGYAFKKEQKIDYTDELVLIITPHIIRNNRNVTLKDLGYRNLR